MDAKTDSPSLLRQRAFQILEHGRRREPASRVVDWVLIGLVLGNVAAAVAQTVPDIAARHGAILQLFDRLSGSRARDARRSSSRPPRRFAAGTSRCSNGSNGSGPATPRSGP